MGPDKQIRKNLLLSSKNCPKQEIILYCNREKPKLVITVKQTFRRLSHNVLTFYLSTLKELMEQQVLFLVLLHHRIVFDNHWLLTNHVATVYHTHLEFRQFYRNFWPQSIFIWANRIAKNYFIINFSKF